MGIRLDQAAALRLTQSTGQPSEQAAPRRPTSVSAVIPQPVVPPEPTVSAPSHAALQVAVEEINQSLQELQTSLEIVRDDASGRSSVVVRDATGEVIRQVPPEAVLHAYVQIRRIVGILLDESG